MKKNVLPLFPLLRVSFLRQSIAHSIDIQSYIKSIALRTHTHPQTHTLRYAHTPSRYNKIIVIFTSPWPIRLLAFICLAILDQIQMHMSQDTNIHTDTRTRNVRTQKSTSTVNCISGTVIKYISRLIHLAYSAAHTAHTSPAPQMDLDTITNHSNSTPSTAVIICNNNNITYINRFKQSHQFIDASVQTCTSIGSGSNLICAYVYTPCVRWNVYIFNKLCAMYSCSGPIVNISCFPYFTFLLCFAFIYASYCNLCYLDACIVLLTTLFNYLLFLFIFVFICSTTHSLLRSILFITSIVPSRLFLFLPM